MRVSSLLPKIARSRLVRLLTKGQFAAYTAGNCLSLLGTWMQRIACSLVVWDMTHSPFWLGVLAAADLLPTVFVGPIGGAVADRWDVLKLNKLSQLAIALTAALLTLFMYLDLLTLSALISIVALQGCVIALGQSARMTIVQELVSRDDVSTAVAINSMNVNLARLVGPALAGLLIVQFDVIWVFLLNTLVTIVFVAVLHHLAPAVTISKTRPSRNVLAEILDGFRYVGSNHSIRAMLLLLLAGGVFVRAIAEMLPAFAAQFSAVPTTGLAVLTSSMAFGSIMAGLTMNTYLSTSRLPHQVTLGWFLSGCAAMAFALGSSICILAVFAMLMGYLSSVSLIATQTFIQLAIPAALRGRALSVHGLIFRASPSLGALGLGMASDIFGLAAAAFASAAVVIVITGIFLPSASRMSFRPDDD